MAPIVDDLIFYTHPMSRGRVVRWLLEEIGCPYGTELLDFGTTMKADDYLAINPMGKVPAIFHRDEVVTETGAICVYLADAYPDAGLAPDPTSPERAPYLRWIFFVTGPLEAVMTNVSLGVEVSEEQKPMVGYGSPEEVFDTLELAITGKSFVAGDRFSAADLMIASYLRWGMSSGSIPERPAFEQYSAVHIARPAAIRAAEIDDRLIPQPAQ